MKILLDESVPRLLKLSLPQLDISTVQEMGQNLSGRKLAILVLPSNQVPVVTQLIPQVETTLATIQPGILMEIPLS